MGGWQVPFQFFCVLAGQHLTLAWEQERERFKGEVCVRATSYVLILWLSLAVLGVADNVIIIPAFGQDRITASGPVSPASEDPDKALSEFNHHVAGWALVGVGFLVLASFLSPELRALRYLWPALFVFAGLFLALWSDAEIWPRGNLSWAWLLHHDQEAAQHKIYALFLIGMGLVEYFRVGGSLNRFWGAWTFAILAVVGAALLLVHDHTASSGASSPEARAYLVNPTLDPDGNPPARHESDPMHGMHHSMMDSGMPMDHSNMDHSTMPIGNEPALADTPSPSHHHHMTLSMLLVRREHFWFMIVGLAVALFKLVSDGEFWRRRFIPYVWPSAMVLLGILLVLYRE
jgi:hypothetical protein